jgi:hypothetical protein
MIVVVLKAVISGVELDNVQLNNKYSTNMYAGETGTHIIIFAVDISIKRHHTVTDQISLK